MKSYLSFAVATVVFVIDRLLKGFFIDRSIACNEGIAFGAYISRWMLFASIGIVLYIFIRWLTVAIIKKDILTIFGISLILSGALSNLIDRFSYGCVADYIHIIPYFPWFNVADMAIFFGGTVFVIGHFRKKQE